MYVRTESLRVMNSAEYEMIAKALDLASQLWKAGRKYVNTWVYVASEDITDEKGEVLCNAFEISLCTDNVEQPRDKYSVADIESLVCLCERQLEFLGLNKEFTPFFMS